MRRRQILGLGRIAMSCALYLTAAAAMTEAVASEASEPGTTSGRKKEIQEAGARASNPAATVFLPGPTHLGANAKQLKISNRKTNIKTYQ